MKIDKEKLKLGIWYEDKEGNMYRNDGYTVGKPNEKVFSYHVCFPTEVNEKVEFFYDKDNCKHPLKYRKRTHGWIKGIKGCKCNKCGKTKTGKSYIPFVFMKWDEGCDTYTGFTSNTHLGYMSQKCVVAMVNSGDYELDEALVINATACERCMNVLDRKYLGKEHGYEEYSEEWKKCGTVCDFCKDEEGGIDGN